MLLTRVRQAGALIRPTVRVMSWHPPLWAGVLGLAYVAKEAPNAYVDYRILVLRLAAITVAVGAAFVLDDPTEETLGHVPTPLALRRALRVALVLLLLATVWWGLVRAAGTVPQRAGGPLPVGDLTLEAVTLLAVALCAASAGARLRPDRVGGLVAGPFVLGLVAVAMFLPPGQRMILSSPADARWEDAHEWWLLVLAFAGVVFVWLNGFARPSLRRKTGTLAPEPPRPA